MSQLVHVKKPFTYYCYPRAVEKKVGRERRRGREDSSILCPRNIHGLVAKGLSVEFKRNVFWRYWA